MPAWTSRCPRRLEELARASRKATASCTDAPTAARVGYASRASANAVAYLARSPHEYADLKPGSHSCGVRAIDRAGNADLIPASYSWTVLEPCALARSLPARWPDSWVLESCVASNYGGDSVLKVASKTDG